MANPLTLSRGMASLRIASLRIAFLGMALLFSASGCTPNERQALYLHELCQPTNEYSSLRGQCSVAGDAELIAGIGLGIDAVRFGPSGTGELRIPLSRISAVRDAAWSFEVLATSRRSEGSELFRSLTWGSCGAECPVDLPDIAVSLSEDNFQWLPVVSATEGVGATGTGFSIEVPTSAALVFRGADIDIIDADTPGHSSYEYDYR